MSGHKDDKPAQHDAPPVHVDTPEQAAARHLIETSPRTTHVHVEPELPPAKKDEKEDFSLQVLDHTKPDKAKAKADEHKGKS